MDVDGGCVGGCGEVERVRGEGEGVYTFHKLGSRGDLPEW